MRYIRERRLLQILSAGSTGCKGVVANADIRKPSSSYAELYRTNDLTGGHVIKLGTGNDAAAREALGAWKGGLQVGGGITEANAQEWLDAGADKVCSHVHTLLSSSLSPVSAAFRLGHPLLRLSPGEWGPYHLSLL